MSRVFVVPSRCKNESHYELLRNLVSWCREGDRIVVVAHNASQDDIAQIRKLTEFETLIDIRAISGKFNFSKFINFGLAGVVEDTIFLINDDVAILDRAALSRMECLAQFPGTGIVGIQLRFADGKMQHSGVALRWWLAGKHIKDEKRLPIIQIGECDSSAIRVPGVTFAMASFSKHIWFKIGYLDERLSFGLQDLDYCLRSREQGMVNYCLISNQAIHYESQTRGNPKSLRNIAKTLRDTLYFRIKHPLI